MLNKLAVSEVEHMAEAKHGCGMLETVQTNVKNK